MTQKTNISYERINDFFRNVLLLKGSKNFENFLKFQKRCRYHAPFNNALVYAQNPQCHYYATSGQWLKRFNREVKDGARALVILFPFGPIEFVYDLSDTSPLNGIDNPQEVDRKLYNWWEEKGFNHFDHRILEKTIENCEQSYKIETAIRDKIDYQGNRGAFGVAYRDSRKKIHIELHPKYHDKEVALEAYGVLCHEIAHHLLGHLGAIHEHSNAQIVKESTLYGRLREDRSNLPKKTEELEAELTAWLVFDMFGIEKNSEPYIAMYLESEDDLRAFDFSLVLKTAGKIRDMGISRVKI